MVDILTAEEWHEIFTTFTANGFSVSEARWAADNNLDPEGPRRTQIRRLLLNRRSLLAWMIRYTGFSRKSLIDDLAEERYRRAVERGDEDPMNLFMGES